MTFLEPLLLWGLPLALLPVIIHLFNRLRHRSIDWGAMMFLLSATRKSTRYARLRQWLILLLRVLALVGLVLAVARPLAGGWLGWMFQAAPDVIVIVLDRSASMEARMPGGNVSKRAEAARVLAEAAQSYKDTSRFVLFDTALRAPTEVGDPSALPQLSTAGATDTAADIPATLQAVVEWAQRNKVGHFEIWLASDLQASNWQPDSEQWKVVTAQIAALPQTVRVRLLTFEQPPVTESWSVQITDVIRRPRAEPPEVEVVMMIDRNNPAPAVMPISLGGEGTRAQVDLEISGPSYRYRHKLPVESATASGWGKVELPADDNPRDNVAYFVYGPPVVLRSLVVTDDSAVGRILQLAAAPFVNDTNLVAEMVHPDRTAGVVWNDYALVLWHAAPPGGAVAAALHQYLEAGGALWMFAHGQPGQFEGISWGEAQEAEEGKSWPITQWQRQEGLLANTEENLALPLNDLEVRRRQPLGGTGIALASFEDRLALLSRRVVGRGELVACGVGLWPEWSNLREGWVLVPAVQRLLQTGGRRFTQAGMLHCGQIMPAGGGEIWSSVEGPKDIRLHAGVYRSGLRMVAVNRPPAEAEVETVEPAKARGLFGPVPVQMLGERKQGEGRLQAELWRMFLFAMLLFLLVEALLILPPKPETAPAVRFQMKGGTP
jgi:hypothetical protein